MDIAVRKGWKEVPLFTAFQKQLDDISRNSFNHHPCVQVESLLSVDRLEAPLQSIISDLERSERGRGGRGGGGGGGEARRRRRSKGTTRKSSESKREEKNQSCDCGSMLERLGAKLDAERGEILETRLTQHDKTLTNQCDSQDVTYSPRHR